LEQKFGFLKDTVIIRRPRRIFADVPTETFREVLEYAVGPAGFSVLCAITGMDEVEKFAVLYSLSRPAGIVLNLRIRLPKDRPTVRAITEIFPVADAYEREIVDLLGIQVEGLPPGNRYPLPDGWPQGQYPLRKDWKGSALQTTDPAAG
jgi:membrane-bound hydrogenase subunit beta